MWCEGAEGVADDVRSAEGGEGVDDERNNEGAGEDKGPTGML